MILIIISLGAIVVERNTREELLEVESFFSKKFLQKTSSNFIECDV